MYRNRKVGSFFLLEMLHAFISTQFCAIFLCVECKICWLFYFILFHPKSYYSKTWFCMMGIHWKIEKINVKRLDTGILLLEFYIILKILRFPNWGFVGFCFWPFLNICGLYQFPYQQLAFRNIQPTIISYKEPTHSERSKIWPNLPVHICPFSRLFSRWCKM